LASAEDPFAVVDVEEDVLADDIGVEVVLDSAVFELLHPATAAATAIAAPIQSFMSQDRSQL